MMHIVEAIAERCDLTEKKAKEVLDTILDFGIPMFGIEEIEGWYTDLNDLLSDSKLYDEPLTVVFAVEFDRKPCIDGELL